MSSPILCVGMSDSSAGAGIQADIKTIQAFGEYAATVVTSVCVQSTVDVFQMYPIPEAIVEAQLKAVKEDFNPRVVKLGMLGNEAIIKTVGSFLEAHQQDAMKLVVDPVMVSHVGGMLLDKPARDAIKRSLLIYADIITPNLREAEELTGLQIRDIDDMKHAAEMLMTLGCKAAVVKSSDLSSDRIYNVYYDDYGIEVFDHPRFESRATHGAGTTLAAGIAASLAKGLGMKDSVAAAQDFVIEAIKTAKIIGFGFGPLNHAAQNKVAR